MASGFQESFGKDQYKPTLGYDDTASLYFGGCILLCILIPWTAFLLKSFIKRHDNSVAGKGCACSVCAERAVRNVHASKKTSALKEPLFLLQLIFFVVLWSALFVIIYCLSNVETISSFDPYEILELSSRFASVKEIRRAHRNLSLKWHPDKNRNNPAATAKYILISKAYQALTDETAKRNFERYGNPDGPGALKIGVGLPRFLLQREYQLIFLLGFVVVVLILIPWAFISYMRKQGKYAENGVMVESIEMLAQQLRQQSRSRHILELLAATKESRELTPSWTNTAEELAVLKNMKQELDDGNVKRVFPDDLLIVRNHYLLLAHIERRRDLIPPELLSVCDALLSITPALLDTLIGIAVYQSWFGTCQAALEVRRALIQAVPIFASPPFPTLLQTPHFTLPFIKQSFKGKGAFRDWASYKATAPSERRGYNALEKEVHKIDVDDFLRGLPVATTLSLEVCVEDESVIVEGDILSITVKIQRENVREREEAGPIHCPFFPGIPPLDTWYIFVINQRTQGIVATHIIQGGKRIETIALTAETPGAGRHTFECYALNANFIGVDTSSSHTFKVLSAKEAQRKTEVHPDDMDLDNNPTLVQKLFSSPTTDSSVSRKGAAR